MTYPLATLLEVRAREEKDAATALARAQDEEARAVERLAAAQCEEAARRQALEEGRARHESTIARGSSTAAEIQAGDRWLEALGTKLGQARAATQACQKERRDKASAVERAHEALAAAVRARKSLDQHREVWEAEQKALAEHKAQDVIDELAARRR